MSDEQSWVRAYLYDMVYGGPEEGGWWFTHITLLDEIPFERGADAEVLISCLKKKHEQNMEVWEQDSRGFWLGNNGYELSSVLGEGEIRIGVEIGESSETTEIPHYC